MAWSAGRAKPIELEDRPPAARRRRRGWLPGIFQPARGAGRAWTAASAPQQTGGVAAEATALPPPPPGRPSFVWAQPVDFFTDPDGEAPELRQEHIPEAIGGFAFDTAERMGVDATSVALGCVVSLASIASDGLEGSAWLIRHHLDRVQAWAMGRHPRPALRAENAGDRRVHQTDRQARGNIAARRRHEEAMRAYKLELKAAQADKTGGTPEPKHPKRDRYLVESTTDRSDTSRDPARRRRRPPTRARGQKSSAGHGMR